MLQLGQINESKQQKMLIDGSNLRWPPKFGENGNFEMGLVFDWARIEAGYHFSRRRSEEHSTAERE